MEATTTKHETQSAPRQGMSPMSGDLLTWADTYNTGIKEVDAQHRTLVALLNQLNQAILNRQGSQVCRDILNQLAEYTKTHFVLEESLMRRSGYAGFAEHQKMHADLLDQVVALQKKLDVGGTSISFELLHFLKNWLTHHIQESDKRFGAFITLNPDAKFYEEWTDEVQATLGKKKKWWQFW